MSAVSFGAKDKKKSDEDYEMLMENTIEFISQEMLKATRKKSDDYKFDRVKEEVSFYFIHSPYPLAFSWFMICVGNRVGVFVSTFDSMMVFTFRSV
jgi:hypothetical protein